MANYSPSNGRRKTAKTSTLKRPPKQDGFPLTPHPCGKWQKKIKGHIYYFGRWYTTVDGKRVIVPGYGREEARKLYLSQIDDIRAGRQPDVTPDSAELTVKDLCNHFLTAMKVRLDAGRKMSARMFVEYENTARRLSDVLGKNRPVSKLRPADFTVLRGKLDEVYGPVRQGNEIQKVKTIFKWGVEAELIPKLPSYGPDFKKPDKTTLRLHRAKGGKRLFSVEELRALLAAASPNLKAMILLGINAALGNNDLGCLESRHLDLKKGWLDFPRPKTAVERECSLWPETVAAIKLAAASRPKAKAKTDSDCVFLTPDGLRCVRVLLKTKDDRPLTTQIDTIGAEFGKLLRKLKINGRKGLGFYSLRHTFRTVADSSKDFPAVRFIMGHTDSSIDDIYREGIDADRLVAVSEHVHKWLFGAEGGAA